MLVENIPAVFFLMFLDEPLSEAYVSPQVEALLGFAQDEWLGNPILWYRQIHAEDKARWSEEAAKLLVSGEPLESTYRVHSRDGHVLHFRCRIEIGRDAAGKPFYGFGVGFDVTQLHETEQALREQVRQLKRANADLEQFAYTAAHDIQTPLRQIHSFAQLVSREYPQEDDKVREWMEYLMSATRRLSALVADIGMYSGIGQAGRVASVDLDDVFLEVLRELEPEIRDSEARIELRSPMPTLVAHRTQMFQLFQNLIGNAVKYRHPDRSPVVELTAIEHDDHWEILIADNGMGIPAEHFQRVFRVFERLHTGPDFEGTGIGLATCKKIVELAGGQITLESQVGLGSVFRFTLPRSTAST
jgi:PAS domain S-box-containing protein